MDIRHQNHNTITHRIRTRHNRFNNTRVLTTNQTTRTMAQRLFQRRTRSQRTVRVETFTRGLPHFNPHNIRRGRRQSLTTVGISNVNRPLKFSVFTKGRRVQLPLQVNRRVRRLLVNLNTQPCGNVIVTRRINGRPANIAQFRRFLVNRSRTRTQAHFSLQAPHTRTVTLSRTTYTTPHYPPTANLGQLSAFLFTLVTRANRNICHGLNERKGRHERHQGTEWVSAGERSTA